MAGHSGNTRKPTAEKYRDLSEMPDDALRALADDLAEVGRIGWSAFKRKRRTARLSSQERQSP